MVSQSLRFSVQCRVNWKKGSGEKVQRRSRSRRCGELGPQSTAVAPSDSNPIDSLSSLLPGRDTASIGAGDFDDVEDRRSGEEARVPEMKDDG